jgi:glycosyl transferase family 11
MVSFKPQGRLGNFLFTAAAMIVYATKHRIAFSVPTVTNNGFWNPVYLKHLVSPGWIQGQEDIVVSEQEIYRFDEIPFDESWRNKQIVLKGYFQNPLYFEDKRQLILDAFNLPWYPRKDYVSIHVRRGDYLTLSEKHPSVPISWIHESMDHMEELENRKLRFVFFSDEINWCKEQFGYRQDCSFVEGNDELTDLTLMSHCEHHINSASTFSWMGAWLNRSENKRVILPKQWLMPSHSNQWTEEIVPKEWIRR